MKNTTFYIVLLPLLLMFCPFFNAQTTDSTRILFIGNSITYTNGMPTIFDSIAKNKGQKVRVTKYTPSSTGFVNHYVDSNVYTKFRAGNWDVVILQPSKNESLGGTMGADSTLIRGKILRDSIYRYNPCAKIFLYEIPFSVPTDSTWHLYFRAQNYIRDSTTYLTDSMHVQMVPVGETFRAYYSHYENLLLHPAYNNIHYNTFGAYMVAASFYTGIFQDSVSGCTYYGSIPPDTAQKFFHLIDSTILSHLPTWRIDAYPIQHETVCESFVAADGLSYNSSGIYTLKIPDSAGCDSTFRLHLTVKHNSFKYLIESACESYIAPDGQVYNSSGIYTAIVPNAAGCDSIILINLSIQHSGSIIFENRCINYTAPDGQIYNTSGTYTATIPNAVGCDSTITIHLTIHQIPTVTNASSNIICGPGRAQLSGNASSGTLNWYDSAIGGTLLGSGTQVLSPEILHATTFYVAAIQDGCESARISVLAETNACTKLKSWYCDRYLTNFSDYMACDAVPGATSYRFEMDDGFSTYTYENPTGGMRFNLVPGIKYGTSYTVKAAAKINGVWMNYGQGCNVSTPSTRIQPWYCNLTVNPMNQYVACYPVNEASQYKFKLVDVTTTLYYTSNSVGFRMSWVPGIQTNTTYQVSVSANVGGLWMNFGPSCAITSAPTMQIDPGNDEPIEENPNDLMHDLSVQLFPNPTNGNFTLFLDQSYEQVEVTITDLQGKIIQQQRANDASELNFELQEAEGVYLVTVRIDGRETKVLKLVKN